MILVPGKYAASRKWHVPTIVLISAIAAQRKEKHDQKVRKLPWLWFKHCRQMNFNEFYGLRNIWDDGCPGEERDSDYLANGIGIAITAAFVVPAIRADRMKSPYIRWGLSLEYRRLYATYP